jgi:hypothetical protein
MVNGLLTILHSVSLVSDAVHNPRPKWSAKNGKAYQAAGPRLLGLGPGRRLELISRFLPKLQSGGPDRKVGAIFFALSDAGAFPDMPSPSADIPALAPMTRQS